MYFINPRGTLCFSKTVGSIKNVQSFRFQHFNPAHPAAGHGNFQNPICAAAELELGEIGSGLGICPVRSQRERERVVDISTSGQCCPALCQWCWT